MLITAKAALITAGVVGATTIGVALIRQWRTIHSPSPVVSAAIPSTNTDSSHIFPSRAGNPLRLRIKPLTMLPIIALLILITATLQLAGNYRVASVMGIVQGLGEFLPISSSAHLIVIPWLLGWVNDQYAFFNTQTFDVALHMGTLLALVVVFWRDWLTLLWHANRPQTAEGKLFWLLVLASLPGAAFGAVLDKQAGGYFSDKYLLIAATLASMGFLLYVVDQHTPERYDLTNINWQQALWIGSSQAFALIPGVSRAGSTMTMGRALGLKRETAAHFSFLMATPITFGAGLLKLRHLDRAAITGPFWLGIALAFIVGLLTINCLLRFLQHRGNSFLPFAAYRLALASVIVVRLGIKLYPMRPCRSA